MAQVVEVTPVVSERTMLLEGFKDIVAEFYGYRRALAVIRKEMASDENISSLSAQLSEKRKYLKENIETFIANADIQGYKSVIAEIEALRGSLKTARKPFNEKMRPLRKAVKLLDNTIIPSCLEELGADTSPRFTLSDWVAERLAAAQKKRKK